MQVAYHCRGWLGKKLLINMKKILSSYVDMSSQDTVLGHVHTEKGDETACFVQRLLFNNSMCSACEPLLGSFQVRHDWK